MDCHSSCHTAHLAPRLAPFHPLRLRLTTRKAATSSPAPRGSRRGLSARRVAPNETAPATSMAPAVRLVDQPNLPFPPFQPLAGSEKGSFAEGTISKRLPAILDGVISELTSHAASLQPSNPTAAAQVTIHHHSPSIHSSTLYS